jgi:hypothetical protein
MPSTIIAHKVTNLGHDRTQLANMARQAKAVIALIPPHFGLIVLQCDSREERLVDAQAKWLDLVKMLGKAKT